MSDKSPRQQMSKKSDKSLKQKRADKRSDTADAVQEAATRKRKR